MLDVCHGVLIHETRSSSGVINSNNSRSSSSNNYNKPRVLLGACCENQARDSQHHAQHGNHVVLGPPLDLAVQRCRV